MNATSSQAEEVFSGLRWTAAGQIVNQGVRFGVSVVLARLLAPEDFGLFAMALVITGFVGIFQSLGTIGTIIQKTEISSELLGSLSTINVVVGLMLAGILAALGSYLAMLYKNPQVAPIIQALGLTLVISSFGLVPMSLLSRDMRFKRLVQIELTTTVIQATSAITLAYLGWKVWALVVGSIVNSTVSTVLRGRASPRRFRWCFNWSEVRNVMSFSLNLTGTHIAVYWIGQADKFIIGRFIGPTSLGYYALAQSLYMLPVEAITTALGRVMFPAFSRIQDDDAQLRRGLLRAIGAVAFITFPMMMGLGVVAHPFIVTVFGAKWSPIIPLIIIFAPAGMLHSIAASIGNVFLAKGRSDWVFWWSLGSGAVTITSFFCGLPWGIVGVASAATIVTLPLSYFNFAITRRLVNLSLVDLLNTLRPYAYASTLMAGLVLGCKLALESAGHEPPLVLMLSVLTGVTSYMSIILFTRPTALLDYARMLPERFRSTKLWAVLITDEGPSR